MSSKSHALIRPAAHDLVPAGPAQSIRDRKAQFRVLIVDNDTQHAETVAEALAGERYDCTVASTGQGGAQLIRSEVFDIIITDLVMNDVDGLEILKVAREELPEAQVILVTGYANVPTAVAAMHQGAFYFLQKPLDLNLLRAVVERAAEMRFLQVANSEYKRRLNERFGFEKIIGQSPQIEKLISDLRRIAPTEANVLILGESGTGKELVAEAIHQNSSRKNKKFVALNCTELGSQILESELFGHVKGAFTDATSDRKGRFESANGGTLFLDEIGEIPVSVQVKLLRVIETREITRVGSNDPIKIDVRLVAATNADLKRLVAEHRFRLDLYQRLDVIKITTPPLRDRPQDIRLLTDFFLEQFAPRYSKAVPKVAGVVRRKFMHYDWPGNVRQLRNYCERMIIMDEDGILDLDDLPEELAGQPTGLLTTNGAPPLSALVGKPMEEVERLFIEETLRHTGGNREEAARMLKIGERTLYRKLSQYEKKTGGAEEENGEL